MRTVDRLFALEEIPILLQYLYMSEEHRISYDNVVTRLTIRMTDNLQILCKNESFPRVPEMNLTEDMTPSYMLSIIEVLKEEKPVEFPDRFSSRWDEIKTITLTNVAQNKMNQRR